MQLLMPIKAMKEFSKTINNADSFILITDDATGDKIHKVLCKEVTSPNFFEKVLSNKEKHGSYIWSDSIAELKQQSSKATRCNVCRP